MICLKIDSPLGENTPVDGPIDAKSVVQEQTGISRRVDTSVLFEMVASPCATMNHPFGGKH